MGPIQTTVGLEVVDSELRIAVLQSRFGKLRLVQSLQIPDFEALSEEDKKNAVSALVKKHGLRRAKAFLTLPRRLGILRQTELPVEVADRARSAIALQVESLSPWSADEVYWDCAWERPGKGAKTIKVTIGIIPRSVLDPSIAFFKSADLPLAGAALSSVAQAHAAVFCKAKSTEDARLALSARPSAVADDETIVSLPIEKAQKAPAPVLAAVCAALLGLGSSAFSLNLIPLAERFRRSHLQLLPTYGLAVLLALLAAAAILGTPYKWYQYGSALDSELAQLAPAVSAVSAQEAEFGKIAGDYRALKSRIEARDLNLEAIRELARVLPSDSWLSGYSSQGRNFTVSGFAPNASAVQKILEESPLFADVQFASSVTRDASGKERFSIKARVEVSE